MNFPSLPSPPFVAVIFANQRTGIEDKEYAEMANRMVELASGQPGYLGINSSRSEDGFGITVSYWADIESAMKWREVAEHRVAQKLGNEKWYEKYQLQIAEVKADRVVHNPPR